MKRSILLLPCALFPYVLLFAIYCLYTGFLMEELFDNFFLVLLFYMGIYFLLTLVLTAVFAVWCLAGKAEAKRIALANMVIKLAQIPAYVVIFVIGVICLISLFTIGFTIFFVLYDMLSICLSGAVGLVAVIRLGKEKRFSPFLVAAGILQFVFCADVVASVVVYLKARKA